MKADEGFRSIPKRFLRLCASRGRDALSAPNTLAALQELFVSRGEPAVADLLFPTDAIDPLM